MTLTVATCQFAVSADIDANAQCIKRQMRLAKTRGANIAHFCEGALSGYAGVDFESFRGFDWERLKRQSQSIAQLAGELGIWVLLGSSHPLSGDRKPHNCVYVIDDRGAIVDRYDKRFCAGDRTGETGDLAHYTPGDHLSIFTVCGIRCGLLICHDYRYPELYREYKRHGIDVMFHCYHAANIPSKQYEAMKAQVGGEFYGLNKGTTLPEITMPASMQAVAASSHLWISCSNSSARESCWPAFFVRADGVIIGRLRRNRAGVLVCLVDVCQPLYDSTLAWRDRAMKGILHSGRLVRDSRSSNRREL